MNPAPTTGTVDDPVDTACIVLVITFALTDDKTRGETVDRWFTVRAIEEILPESDCLQVTELSETHNEAMQEL